MDGGETHCRGEEPRHPGGEVGGGGGRGLNDVRDLTVRISGLG